MILDLSHSVGDGVVTYPGLPAPRVTAHMNREPGKYAEGTTFHIARIEMVANTGTYIDAPFHRYADGADIGALPLERLVDLPGVVIDHNPPEAPLDTAALRDLRGCAVLFRTRWSRHFGTEAYGKGHPYLTREVAEALALQQPAVVGIDSLNIDSMAPGERPVQSILLAAGIPIVEHLTNLAPLPDRGFRFFAAPAKFAGTGTFIVRAFAITRNVAPEPD